MSDLNGENLLRILRDVNVQLLNLNPNVVKGWFDTDDNNMKNLLKWMCTSLSTENFVSPLENTEYNEFQSLSKAKLQQEVYLMESNYQDIFDIYTTELDIGILENELEMLMDEENNLENLLFMSEQLQTSLNQTWNDKLILEIKTELELLNTQKKCNQLSEDLDERNANLYKQLIRLGNNLFNFEFREQPYFINNIDIEHHQETFENLTSLLKPFLEDPLLSFSCSMVPNSTCLSITGLNESLDNSLSSLRKRMNLSHQLYINSKIEEEKMKEILDFFARNSVNSIISLSESAFMQYNIKTKKETKSRMLTILEKFSIETTEQQISLTKLEYTKNELEMYEQKLGILSTMEELLIKLLSQYLVLCGLYQQEKVDIESSDDYFRKVIHYITQDLQNCISSTARMKETIKQFKSIEPKEKFKLIKCMLGVLGVNNDLNLNKAFETLIQFKNNLHRLEEMTLSSSTDHKTIGKALKQNIQALQSFLICGPTYSLISVPYELVSLIRKTEDIIEKQNESIRKAVGVTISMKTLNQKKWYVYKRQLWMYFYKDSEHLKFIMHQIEEDFLKIKMETNKN